MSRLHKIKRLRHPYRTLNQLPSKIIDEEFVNRTSQYVKYFDYALAQLLADHSTDPLQNLTRQYSDRSMSISNQGRFVNHEMIIRRNGETTILRPKHDVVLASGFTPVIRPSSILSSHHSIISHSQIDSSVSIMTKMSMKICDQTPIIKTKRKTRHFRKRCNEVHNQQMNRSNNQNFNHLHQPHLLDLVKQAIHNLIDRQTILLPPQQQPPPLMSILPQFHSPQNQPSTTRSINYSPYTNDQSWLPPSSSISVNRYPESFSNIHPTKQYQSFPHNSLSYFNPSPLEHFHFPMYHERNFTSMTDYLF